MFKMGYTKTVLKFSARKIFTKIAFLSLQNVGWTGFHYSRKGEYTAASIDVAPYGEVYAPKLTSPPPEGYDTSVAFALPSKTCPPGVQYKNMGMTNQCVSRPHIDIRTVLNYQRF